MPTLEEVRAAEAAAQKKKDDEMQKYLTIPPDGKPPNEVPPDAKIPEGVESDEDRQKRAENERKENTAMRGVAAQQPVGMKKPIEDDDDDDDKPKPRTPVGRR